MSTSDWSTSDGGRLPPDASVRPGAELLPGGVLDPGILARMANEFFGATPDLSSAALHFASPGPPTDAAAFSSAPASVPAAPPEVSLPSDPHFPGVPASAGPAAVAPVSTQAHVSPPVIPGVLGSAIQSESPTFSFVQDARPLILNERAPSADTYPAARPITEFANPEPAPIGHAFVLDEGSLLTVADVASPPSPTVPGALGRVDSSAIPAFSFLEEARPLFSSTPSLPGPVPTAEASGLPTQAPNESLITPSLVAPFGFLRETRSITLPASVSTQEPVGIEPNVPSERDLSSYSFDAEALKRDFPILRERVHGRPIVWLDNAATTQKPQSVIDRLTYFYEHENSNVHRAAHELAARATDAYESAREKVRRFLNASSSREIVFVRGATEGINLIAQSWGRQNIQKDDEIVITWLEHHANIVPWQMLASDRFVSMSMRSCSVAKRV